MLGHDGGRRSGAQADTQATGAPVPVCCLQVMRLGWRAVSSSPASLSHGCLRRDDWPSDKGSDAPAEGFFDMTSY
jgi:hypothetical protein